jgi:hypothetical protein
VPAISVTSVTARLKTSERSETRPPLKTSGAMKRGVPTAIVPWLDSPSSRATPKSTSTTPRSAHDQVLRLDVAVDDVLLVDVVQGLARLAAPLDDLVHRQARRALGQEAVVQALARR